LFRDVEIGIGHHVTVDGQAAFLDKEFRLIAAHRHGKREKDAKSHDRLIVILRLFQLSVHAADGIREKMT
ncbi:MAG: hypothetical protein AAF660_08935, partial [Pseudomonadota bacterium]